MKAIRKSDGKEIEVTLLKPRQYVSAEKEDGVVLKTVYLEDGLILEEPVDWSAFRRETAREILAGFAAKIGHTIDDYSEQSCKYAIRLADELIKQLKYETN